MSARFRQLATSDLTPVGLFMTCAAFAGAAVPTARSGSALLAVALAGLVTTLGCLVGWILYADRLAIARERLADPVHLSNWWPDFERQFWLYIEARA
jgi:hypothetical protein